MVTESLLVSIVTGLVTAGTTIATMKVKINGTIDAVKRIDESVIRLSTAVNEGLKSHGERIAAVETRCDDLKESKQRKR